jgi:hypothetical protein
MQYQRLGVAFVVNPPRVFSAFWKILTPWMNETTLNKIKFVGGHKGTPPPRSEPPWRLETATNGSTLCSSRRLSADHGAR